MAMINETLKAVKGYYCGYCDKFYNPQEVKKTYTIEVIGSNITIKNKEISCPNGCHNPADFEEFNPEWWTHLAAMVQKKYADAVWVKVPIYESINNPIPTSYVTVRDVRLVEGLSDGLFIKVVNASIDEFGLVDIEVDFE